MTGGAAVEHHLRAAGRPPIRDEIADLDLVVGDVDGLSPRVCDAFLVAHYHRCGPGVPKALVQLVDPRERLRIDIFPDIDEAIVEATRGAIGATSLLILSARSILEHKLRTVAKSSAASPVDTKHWRDATALAALVGRALPAPPRFAQAAQFSTDVDARCARCEQSATAGFPLAPKARIFALLGYV